MYKPVRGPLLSAGHGVVGASNSHATVRLFPGALKVLQELYTGLYPGVRVAVASSADNAKAVDCARACLKLLEVFPGVTAWEVLGKGHPAGTDGHLQIGRSPPLSANKTGHFRELKKHTGIPYDRMLFFDDCNWSDKFVSLPFCSSLCWKVGGLRYSKTNTQTTQTPSS